MCLRVEIGNSWYLFVGDLASICGGGSLVVFYGREKFVSKNVSKRKRVGRCVEEETTCAKAIAAIRRKYA
jgi:hypothetical protein